MSPLVSIITPTYNSAATLRDTLDSVARQDYPVLEHIVVDGGSSDGTQEMVRQAGRRATLLSEPDKGLYDAMNKGLKLAQGDIIGILNSDDFYAHEHVVSRIVRLMDAEGADVAYGDLCYVAAGDPGRVVRYWRSGAYRPGKFLYGWMPPHPTFFVRRQVYEQLGGFDLALRFAADYELMLRFLHRHRLKAAYLPEVLVHMRTGGVSNSSLRHRLRANREDREAWRRNGLRPYFFTTWLKPLRKIPQYFLSPPAP